MKRGRLKPVWRPNGPLPGDQVWEGEMTADTLTKDESIRLMQAEIKRLREAVKFLNSFRPDAELAKRDAEIERLRGLLHECLSFALGAPIGWSSDLWERVTETLGQDMLDKSTERILRRIDRMGFAGAGEALREIERLGQQVTQRGARMQVMRDYLAQYSGSSTTLWRDFLRVKPEATEWFDGNGVPR